MTFCVCFFFFMKDAGENGSDAKKEDGEKAGDEPEKKTRKRKSPKEDSSNVEVKKSRKAKKGYFLFRI